MRWRTQRERQVGAGPRRALVAGMAAATLVACVAAGCAPAVEHPFQVAPAGPGDAGPRHRVLVPIAVGGDPAMGATLAVALRPEGPGSTGARGGAGGRRALRALPDAWDAATLTLTHPTALAAARTATLARDVDLVANGAGGYAASTTFGDPLRPAAGYTLAVELWDGGATTGVVVARKTVTVNLVAGPNAVSVALALVGAVEGAPYAATGTASTQADPTIAAGPTHALALWADDRAGLKEDVIARQAAADGTLPGADQTLTGALDLAQALPHLALDPSRGRFLAAWQSADLLPDVLGTLVDADGTPVGTPLTLASAVLSDMRAPRVAYDDADDQYAVVWADNRSLNWDIYGQRVGGDGTPAGANVALASGLGDQDAPDVAASSASDQVLVAWRDASTSKVRAAFWGGSAFDVSATTTSANVQPAVGADPVTGDFLVAWVHQASPHQVRVRRVEADGTLGAETAIDATGSAKAQPRVCYVPWLARFLVAWQVDVDATAATDHDVYGRYVLPDGTGAGAAFVIAGGAGNQTRPEAAALAADRRVVVSFADDASGGQRVRLQRLY